MANYQLMMETRRHITHSLLVETAAGLGINLAPALEVDGVDVHRELLVNHASCTVIPYSLFSSEKKSGQLAARRIVNPLFQRTLYLLHRGGGAQAMAETAIINMIENIIVGKINEGSLRWKNLSIEY